MALKGKPPEEIQKRAKLLLYGPPNSGKTMFALHTPKCYFIDAERGAENKEYSKQLRASKGHYYFSNDLDDIIGEVKALMTDRHDFQWLVIDPVNVPYQADLDSLAEKNAAKGGDGTGMEFGRHKLLGDRKMRHLFNLIYRLDMNVIITAHAKTRWEGEGNNRREAGITFDGYAKMEYIFDLIFELSIRGKEHMMRTAKTRHENFPLGEILPLDFEAMANTYGREVIERKAEPIQLASFEQALELEELLSVRIDGEELKEKWLKKAMADTLAELPAKAAEKCIEFLKKGAKE